MENVQIFFFSPQSTHGKGLMSVSLSPFLSGLLPMNIRKKKKFIKRCEHKQLGQNKTKQKMKKMGLQGRKVDQSLCQNS